MQQELHECMLCYEQSKFIGLSKCNHGPFCIRCVYKMRVISKSNSCPICKAQSKQLVISSQFCKFEEISGQILADKVYSDVLHCGPEAKKEFQKLMELKCFVKINGRPCKHEKAFSNMAFLKKHLKEDHKRVLCDVCLEKKTCVLQEQKLYTQAQLNRHLERGDIDQSGNIIFMHPYCTFCKKYFFNDEQFRVHIGLEHMLCNVCGNLQRYRYYSNYDSLEVHYKISHYICSDAICLAKKFIAFRSAEQLRVHKAEIHNYFSGKRIDGKQLCGFQYEGVNKNYQQIEIKDNEGIDMQDQFLALKKSKNRALGQVDAQEDAIIDLRDFFPSGLEQDEHLERSFVLRHKSDTTGTQTQGKKQANQGGKKKKYVQKAQFQKQKPQIAKQNQKFFVEDLNLLKTFHLSRLYYDTFTDKLSLIVDKSSLNDLQSWRNKYNKRHMSAAEFLTNFLNMMKKYSLKSGYEIFPHFIRTVTNQHAKIQLDHQYILSLKKLPMKTESLLSKCKKYSELFEILTKQIEVNIQTRIVSEQLSIKKMPNRCKQRLYQIIGVVRRLKTEEMAKFKFATNFGVQIDTCEFVHNSIIKKQFKSIQEKLSKISNDQLLDLYVFIKYCHDAILHSENIHITKNKIHENILEDFLYHRPELQKKYGRKKEELKTLDQQIQYEKIQEQRIHNKKMKDLEIKNKNMGYHAKTNFNLNDKGDFPELLQPKKAGQDSHENFRDVMHNAKSKPATYQKKINQLFPTIGAAEEQSPKKEEEVKHPTQKKEKAWWQKINDTKKIDIEEQKQVVKVRKGKNKKQKWVSVKGLF